jgi:hypothetical protein
MAPEHRVDQNFQDSMPFAAVPFLLLLPIVLADIVPEVINTFLPVSLVHRFKVLNETRELTFIADGQQK